MFYDLYKNSVKNTLNINQPIGVALSGGLDSSSIVSLGHHINPSVDFRTYSYTFEEYDKGNEDTYINTLLKMVPTQSTFIKADNLWYFKGEFSKIIGEFDEPYPHFSDAFMGEIPNKLKEEGVKILVSGIYGDHVLAGNPLNQALLLKNLKLFTLVREYRGSVREMRIYNDKNFTP